MNQIRSARTLHTCDKPLADRGLLSYRYRLAYGFVMIGAASDADALAQARRSTSSPCSIEHLERWCVQAYVPCVPGAHDARV